MSKIGIEYAGSVYILEKTEDGCKDCQLYRAYHIEQDGSSCSMNGKLYAMCRSASDFTLGSLPKRSWTLQKE